ncbi:MAG: UdgX family uracil-DNA binding protein [Undibacterium sp.]|nr:UdgX family uracil-DNA binding protein [Opitutaceae bacterium]
MNELFFDGTFVGWKRAARGALVRGVDPAQARWIDARSAQTEFMLANLESVAGTEGDAPGVFRVPREFMTLSGCVSCHRDESRWTRLYRLLWRLTHGEPHLLEGAIDAEVSELNAMAKAVRRDEHKMHAFVRFREITTATGAWFVAWFEPQHLIVELAAPFFADRFAAMRWSILTPDRCAHWDGKALTFAEGADRSAAPTQDAAEDLWRTYYASIFNPARVKIGAMTKEMPRHYWKNLPEAALIPQLLAESAGRTAVMVAASEERVERATDFSAAAVPVTDDVGLLRDAAASCRACPLWRRATCTVFGEGPVRPRVVVVGEQPGDQEDRVGKPFVGPAGLLFNRALVAAGVERAELYVTNAVKHFKWEPRGKLRLHQKPNAREIAACRPWLEAELRALKPALILCLGATAAQAVLGSKEVRVLSDRGQLFPTEFGAPALITVHPSSLLRMAAGGDPEAAFALFVEDLKKLRG